MSEITKAKKIKQDMLELSSDMFKSQNFFTKRIEGNDPISLGYMYGAHELKRFREELERIIHDF